MGAQEVFDALGGGLVGLLGAALLIVSGLLLASLNSRLKDWQKHAEKREQENGILVAKLDPLTNAVERLTGAVETAARERELERRRSAR